MESERDSRAALGLYATLSRLERLGYPGKIMLVAFLGTHVPLLALVGWFLATSAAPGHVAETLVVALAATLLGTAATLVGLHHLLRPVTLTARTLRAYVAERTPPALPTGFGDAVGRLMCDTSEALHELERTRVTLERTDPTTGLPNRAGLLRLLAERVECADAGPFALCTVSVSGLDEIASAFGRLEADRMLRLAAAALDAVAPAELALCRVDFSTLALVIDTADPEAIATRLARFDGQLERLHIDGLDNGLVCRRGVALWPLDDRGSDALLDDALVALEIARRRNVPWAFYSEGSRHALIERYRLGRELRTALEDNQLVLHYQPVVDVSGERIVGAEALVRWRHPVRGLLPPGRFIPIAEESALIERLGLWTLEAACRQIRRWRDGDVDSPPVAVNLSARQFADPGLHERITRLVSEYGILPGELEVELTETSATADLVGTRETMKRLRELGIGLAIDDFGTGYSSLSHLRTMPFDKLKIDREFVRDVDANDDHLAICRSLIALGRELRLKVLAEGVERGAEVEALREEGCRLFQGYHYYRPLSAASFTRLLIERRAQVARRVGEETG